VTTRRGFRRFGAFLLLGIALAGGPGLTALEVWSHTERNASPHGPRPHFETQGGQDHSDRCEIGLIASPARASVGECSILRLGRGTTAPLHAVDPARAVPAPRLLPPSRAPPWSAFA